ncbi:adenylate/guanylate cyclase domain-containing protein [Aliiroseovarius sp. F20344]|uniref:ATP-binding protein n=1 Tax=Aliiroseovarius sp. F20344 TaxID=2926414 RepID=UPI001FF1F5CE|nr:adenylate/guanylate cyclase domain-containing protein [Aliiroseovarius sp. F20344]MCK0142955.1 AAA family ATPase [Aliiroseovarius sp. F20344]
MQATNCLSCAEPLVEGARFCSSCGAEVIANADNPELRILTIQFIDLVGSTAFASSTELETYDDTIAAFHQQVNDTVETYRGRVLQRYGDGVLSCFGLDHDGEDSALSAIASGLSIAKTMPERVNGQQVRVGIDTGQIMCRVGQQGTLFPQLTGLHVNRAARLQEQAKTGGVVISGQTKSFLSRLARLDEASQDTRKLKGIDEPVDLIEVTGFHFEEDHTKQSELLERDKELALLQDDDNRAHALIGPAGIGKSVLLDAFDRAQTGANAIKVDARANLQQSALFPITETLRHELCLKGQSALSDLNAKLKSIGITLSDQDQMVMAGLLGLQAAQPVLLTPEQLQSRRVMLATRALAGLAITRRAAITFDDLHWFDDDTITVLEALLKAEGGAQRIVVTSRPSDKIDALLETTSIEAVHLSPLSDEAAQTALSSYPEFDDTQRRQIIDAAEGNPLFLSALATHARQFGSGDASQQLPQTIEATFQAIINGFGALRDVIQCASVLGREFRSDHVAHLLTDRQNLEDELGVLTIRGIFNPRADGLSFDHILLRDAAYEMIPGKRRRTLHKQFADAMQVQDPAYCATYPHLMADHRIAARDHEQLPAACMHAGIHMLMAVNFDQSMAYLDHARTDMEAQAAPEKVTRMEYLPVLSLLASATVQRMGFAHPIVLERYQLLEDAVGHAEGTDRQRMTALYGLFAHRIINGRVRESGEYADMMKALAENGDDELKVIWLVNETAHALYSGQFDRAAIGSAMLKSLYKTEEHGRLFLELGADPLASVLSADAHVLARKGDLDGALAAMSKAHEHLNAIGAVAQIPWIHIFGGQALLAGGHLDLAEREIQAGIEVADEQQAQFWSLNGRLWLTIVQIYQGHTAETPAALEMMVEQASMIGAGLNAPFYKAALAKAYLANGDLETSQSLLDQAKILSDEVGEYEWDHSIREIRTELSQTQTGVSAPPGLSSQS